MREENGYIIYTKTELRRIIKKHNDWLMDKKDKNGNSVGERANLRYTNLAYADLYNANLENANLYKANLYKANLFKANLVNANLENADLRYADLRYANLRYTNLAYANLENANLENANLKYANLVYANLYNANLYDANLKYANLYNAKKIPFIRMACPDIGSFVAWKKLQDNCIAKLLIPETAKRSSATTSKCRASEAIVLSIEDKKGESVQIGYSQHDIKFVYEVGKHLIVDDFDEDRFNECSTGIHFFINKQEAIDY